MRPIFACGAQGKVTLTVPANRDGSGYVCYAPAGRDLKRPARSFSVTQDYEGAVDWTFLPPMLRIRHHLPHLGRQRQTGSRQFVLRYKSKCAPNAPDAASARPQQRPSHRLHLHPGRFGNRVEHRAHRNRLAHLHPVRVRYSVHNSQPRVSPPRHLHRPTIVIDRMLARLPSLTWIRSAT